MSLVVVVLLSPSLCRLHHTFCIPAPCSPSSNSHILSLLGIVTVICVSPYPMHSPAQLLYCRYKHTPPSSRTQHYAAFITSYIARNDILYCTLCVDQTRPCLSGIPPIPVFSLCTPRLPTESQLLLHYLPYLCSAFTI